ncbi:hypothetical protein, variant 2 [Aphanomyces astaci]|nr:hypothetical protein, variant 2 [Aphanomyces astaci]ETV83019.1 hypothetical protein, variant 2 [Aphanomyces astaci]|eukprot:XP_009827690.1 hypothetical protein, variant 2 [Aphanomyces astaci]
MATPGRKKAATGASLLDALSPQLMSLVEASLGHSLAAPSSVRNGLSSANASPPPQRSTVQPPANRGESVIPQSRSSDYIRVGVLNPSEIFLLRQADSPGFVVREHFLGPAAATAVHDACLGLTESTPMRPAQVGVGKSTAVTCHVADARGDQLVWLPHDKTALPPPLQHLLAQIERLMHGLAKAAPELGVRNVKSTQLAVFPGHNTRFVPHVDTYDHNNNAKQHLSRRITCLYYLNPSWESSHGGALRMHLQDGTTWDIPPVLDTLVVFRSTDVLHEVLPTTVHRLALTTWYYGGGSATTIPSTPPSATSPTPTTPSFATNIATRTTSSCVTGSNQPLEVAGGDATSTIFVSIPSYCDSECQPTVAHLFATAAAPSRVFVGLCLQHEQDDQSMDMYGEHVRIKRMRPADATGPCLARWETQQLWKGEAFYLQIDSHMRFRRGWDVYLIDQLRRCSNSPQGRPRKAILTTYPLGYTLPNEIPNDTRPTLLCASAFDSHGMLRQCGKVLKTSPSS